MLLGNLLGGNGFFAATPENPSFDLNSPDVWDAFGATKSATGQSVSAETALTWDAWYRGVSLLALYIAKTPLHVWQKVKSANDTDGRTQADDHPAYKLLRWKANEVQTAFQLQLALAGHAVNRGNGYAYIERQGATPVGLLLLDPDGTYMPRDSRGQWYVTKVNGESRKIPAADMWHVRGFGFDGFTGYSAWQMAKEQIGLANTLVKFKGTRYKNQARPSVVLETAARMQPQDRKELREDWERMHTGLDNAHRTAILDNGLKVSKLTFSAEEMQEVEQSGIGIRAAANFLGVPSSKLGDVAGIKYASKEQDDLAFLNDGLDFWFCAIEDESRDKLLLESEQDSGEYLIEFDRTTVARGDSAARANYNRTALAGQPWKTQNEVRREEGLEPVDDEGADELKTPLNMGQGGADNQPEDVSKPGPGKPADGTPDGEQAIDKAAAREAFSASLADTAGRMIRRVGTHAVKAAKEPKTFTDWTDTILAEHTSVFSEAFAPVAKLISVFLKSRYAPNPGAALLLKIIERYESVADSTTAAKLLAAVEKDIPVQERELTAFLTETFLGESKP